MRLRAKVDSNQPEVVKALRDIGATVDTRPQWKCANCGCERRPTAHQMRQTYCSKECMAEAYRSRMRGTENPNFSGAGQRLCDQCGGYFRSYNSARKYCGSACAAAARTIISARPCEHCGESFRPAINRTRFCCVECFRASRPRQQRVPRPRPIHLRSCRECNREFRVGPKSIRKFCSYDCFVKSGGPKRAGQAAMVAKRKYGNKKDANHNLLFEKLKEHSVPHIDLSPLGCGVPDGVAHTPAGWQLFDVKNLKTGYGRRGLNKNQREWAENWQGGCVFLVHDESEMVAFIKGEFAALQRFPEDAPDPVSA